MNKRHILLVLFLLIMLPTNVRAEEYTDPPASVNNECFYAKYSFFSDENSNTELDDEDTKIIIGKVNLYVQRDGEVFGTYRLLLGTNTINFLTCVNDYILFTHNNTCLNMAPAVYISEVVDNVWILITPKWSPNYKCTDLYIPTAFTGTGQPTE